jgi:hypothetical protein
MTPKYLVPGSKKWIESFLTDCANLPLGNTSIWDETDKRAQKVIARYPEVFAGIGLKMQRGQETWTSRGLGALAHGLQRIWDAPNLWSRNWYIYKLADFYHGAKAETEYLRPYGGRNPGSFDDVISATEEPPPASDPFMLALVHLQRTDKARHCPNAACLAPYFFATKRRQMQCSLECAAECSREQKRRWWADNRAKNGGAL